ncbi:MAG: barstar family protein [Pseudomonadota bacterium]|nr:barstar family protein [Pseudomonadota bacterium]
MAIAELKGAAIVDMATFHAESKKAFGFPADYAGTMDAWIDCMSYLRDEDGMSKFRLFANEALQIVVLDADILREKAPEILEELTYCVAGLNDRYEDYGEKPALQLILK